MGLARERKGEVVEAKVARYLGLSGKSVEWVLLLDIIVALIVLDEKYIQDTFISIERRKETSPWLH